MLNVPKSPHTYTNMIRWSRSEWISSSLSGGEQRSRGGVGGATGELPIPKAWITLLRPHSHSCRGTASFRDSRRLGGFEDRGILYIAAK